MPPNQMSSLRSSDAETPYSIDESISKFDYRLDQNNNRIKAYNLRNRVESIASLPNFEFKKFEPIYEAIPKPDVQEIDDMTLDQIYEEIFPLKSYRSSPNINTSTIFDTFNENCEEKNYDDTIDLLYDSIHPNFISKNLATISESTRSQSCTVNYLSSPKDSDSSYVLSNSLTSVTKLSETRRISDNFLT